MHNCDKMRSSGCLPFLIKLLHTYPEYEDNNRPSRRERAKSLFILNNIVQHQSSVRQNKRETKVLGILWLIRQYSDFLRDVNAACQENEISSARVVGAGCRNVHLTVLPTAENLNDFIVCGKIFSLLEKIVSQSLYFRL